MTKKELMDMLERDLNEYLDDVEGSIKRNSHMHNYKEKNKLSKKNRQLIEAVLVGYLNHVGRNQGLDLGLYTYYLKCHQLDNN